MANTLRTKPDPTPTNTATPDPQPTTPKPKAAPKSEHKFIKNTANWGKMLATERTKLTIGAVCVLAAAVMAVAFLSHLFVWQNDQNLVSDIPAIDFLFDKNLAAQNLLGRLGALISHLFIYGTFGTGAFAIPYILGLFGTRILGYKFDIDYKKHYQNALILMLAVSFSLGFFWNNWNIWGGMFGYFTTNWLLGFVGNFGTFLITLFIWFAVIRVYFGVIFNFDGILEGFKSEKSIAASKKNTPRTMPVPIEPTTRIDIDEPLELYTPSPEPYLAPTDSVRPIQQNNIDDNFEVIAPTQPPLPLIIPTPDLKITPPPAPTPQLELEVIATPTPTNHLNTTTAPPTHNLTPYDPTLELSQYQYPTIGLLDAPPVNNNIKYDEEELRNYKNQIVETLRQFGIEIDRIRATVGPTVTLYEIVPAAGVRISKIKNLEDDIALNLAALGIRIIAPMPGKGTIGIEVPNHHKEIVNIATVFSSEKFLKNDYELPIALGKTISNEVFVTDLAKMPHLLMAGATGQGKSVGLNVILASLLYKKHPSQIKFVMVDPKKVELSIFRTIERHFLAKLPNDDEAIITDTAKVVSTLNSLCMEMDARYDLLKDANVRNIAEYNLKFINRRLNPEKGHAFMPYIILVVDEFADLMITAGKEVEQPITRLAQLARAVGIHLIIATQRPSTNIITGTIKANFPARIAFKVASYIDSRTILDSKGAEQLVGRGDMLLSQGSEIIRLQCAYVTTDEIERIANFIGEQQGYSSAFMLPEFVGNDAPHGAKSIDELADRDIMLADAARTLVANQQGSTSLIQRKLKLGYARSGRIMDQLEALGIVGKFEGSRPREVMFHDLASLEVFLKENGF